MRESPTLLGVIPWLEPVAGEPRRSRIAVRFLALLTYGLVSTGAAVLFLRAHGLGYRILPPQAERLVIGVTSQFLLVVPGAVVLWGVSRRLAGRARPEDRSLARATLLRCLSPRLIAGAVPYILLFILCSGPYESLKPAVLKLRPAIDDALWPIEEAFFLGHPPYEDLARFAHPVLTGGLDVVYGLFFISFAVSFEVLYLRHRHSRRTWHFVASVVLAFHLGWFGYWLFPSMGPCYDRPELFPHVEGTFSGTTQAQLLRWHRLYAASPTAENIHLGCGIAAMPSLHVAITILCAAFAERGTLWRRALWAFALATWIATIYLGWHYAIDGVAAAGLALAAWALGGLLVRAADALHDRCFARPS